MAPRRSIDPLFRSRVKLRQLALVVAIGERRSLRLAAADIAVSQPAATKLLQDLEDAFGASLFERHRWGMQPTLYGETLIRYARAALTDLDEARDEIAALGAGAHGKLRVGAVTGAVPRILAPAIEAVRADAPALELFVLVNASEVLAGALREGTLDAAIGPPLAPALASGLAAEPLGREALCVVARRGHPLARRRGVAAHSLADATWIVQPQGSAMREAIDAFFRREHLVPSRAMIETVSIVATLALLDTLSGVAVLPLALARYYEQRELLVRLPVQLAGGTDYVLMFRTGRELSPAALHFIAAVRRVAVKAPGIGASVRSGR